MNTLTFRLLPLFVVALGAATVGLAQETPPKINFPAPSPTSTLKQRVGLTDVEVVYARPSMRGRKIFGGLEPYGAVWRTGANTATKITFSTPVKIGGTELPAGSYALYSIPGQDEWTVIFNKVAGEWGAYTYKQENDAVRVKAKPVTLPTPVETFTIDLSDLKTESATLNLIWEKTRVPVTIEVSAVADVVAQIDKVMGSGAKLTPAVYFSAAQFYYDNNLDIAKARAWIEEATKDEKAPFYFVYWKAKILARAGDKAGARAAAEKSKAMAGEPYKAEYTRLNDALLAELK